ncbi:glycosyltransferase family 9 protein [Dysgonomonas sp. 520]|uniref:glycosyltransferase family 9 protein n=1 Tax=Dysgonomonas sp. 520 TaxID=2302931 RepID=UPI0013D259D7|nr:glycosyltransferase family 9 protein [Dysgonomonas sp. 520]NDW10886.1 lipopolysaccharide heptosyltransferase family protein [Dysgonomonas sp. 520]
MSNVLIIRLSAFGDVAMLVPVVQSVASQHPRSKFYVLTRPAFTPLFNNLGFNISTIPLDVNGKHRGGRYLSIIPRLIIKLGITHVVDEHDVLRSKLIRWTMKLSGRKVVHIDKGREEKKKMIESKVLQPPLKSTIQRYLDTFEEAGFPAEITFRDFFEFTDNSFSLIKEITPPKNGRWIGVAPFSKHETKNYPLEKVANVIDRLAKETNNTIFLFGGGKKEKELLAQLKDGRSNVILPPKINLTKELHLISHLDVMISMDSANMHLASLVQVPVVSIWGATHPSLGFYGFNQDIENAVQTEPDCRPCSVFGNVPCARGDYLCLTSINEDTIIEKVNKILNKE